MHSFHDFRMGGKLAKEKKKHDKLKDDGGSSYHSENAKVRVPLVPYRFCMRNC